MRTTDAVRAMSTELWLDDLCILLDSHKADGLAFTIKRADLEPIMMCKATFSAQAAAGRASLRGNPQVLQQLMACLVEFDQYFEIMPGTRAVVAAPSLP